MTGINAGNLTLKPEQITNYFTPPSKGIGLAIFLIITCIIIFAVNQVAGAISFVVSIAIIVMRAKKRMKSPTDEEIDAQWTEIAKQREDEAYRVAHMEKSDAIRDAQYFYTRPTELPDGDKVPTYKIIEGKDEIHRRNCQRLVYMIYTQNQLIVFDENLCIENNWEGKDNVQEYYWKDVSSIGFDQKTNTLEIACGPKIVEFPLQGDRNLLESIIGLDFGDEKYSTTHAEELSNSIRVMLREIKSS